MKILKLWKRACPAKPRRSGGFTLAEMLVAISIMAIISSVLIGSRKGYSEQLDLKNQAYSLALSFREAQVESLGVKALSGNFNISYGLHFEEGWTNQFVYFTDSNVDGVYSSASGDTGRTVTLTNNVTIQSVCYNSGSSCWGGNYRKMAITWKRPGSTPSFIYTNGGGNNPTAATAPVFITLRSASGRTITVRVGAVGGISVQ